MLAGNVLEDLAPDAILLMGCKAVRMFSFSFLAVILVVFLKELKFSESSIGLMITLTLLGDAVISMVIATHADLHWGRKQSLLYGTLLTSITGVMFAVGSNFWILLFCAIFGVISPSGSEVGPFMALELSCLSQVTTESKRAKIIAWYNLFGCFGSAGGALFCGWTVYGLMSHFSYTLLSACRFMLVIYAIIQGCMCLLFMQLSPNIEVVKTANMEPKPGFGIGLNKSKSVILRLSFLFCIDAFAGAFILQSFISNWFHITYNTNTHVLGMIICVCNLVAGISALFAAKLAESIGLIMTMVVTHLPSNVLTILVPIMPNELLAIIMICARYCISQMDVPTRNAYVQNIVPSEERSAANSVVNVVRSISCSIAPFFAGLCYGDPQYQNYPFYIAGGLKIIYDILLLYSFADNDTSARTTIPNAVEYSKVTQIEMSDMDADSVIVDKELDDVNDNDTKQVSTV